MLHSWYLQFEMAPTFFKNVCTPDYNKSVKLLRLPAENIPVAAAQLK